MADYKLDCCGGFPGHKAGCLAGAQAMEAEERRLAAEIEEVKRYDAFFAGMTDEELFAYVRVLDRQIKLMQRFVERRRRATDYIRKSGKIEKYFEDRRNG